MLAGGQTDSQTDRGRDTLIAIPSSIDCRRHGPGWSIEPLIRLHGTHLLLNLLQVHLGVVRSPGGAALVSPPPGERTTHRSVSIGRASMPLVAWPGGLLVASVVPPPPPWWRYRMSPIQRAILIPPSLAPADVRTPNTAIRRHIIGVVVGARVPCASVF